MDWLSAALTEIIPSGATEETTLHSDTETGPEAVEEVGEGGVGVGGKKLGRGTSDAEVGVGVSR